MQRINTQWMAGALALGMMMAAARSNPVLQTWDFESGDLTGWNLVPATQGGDTLFKDGRQPVSHTRIGGKQGTWWIDTYRMNDGSQGDAFTGIIETDPFILPGNAEFTMISGGGTFAWSGTPQSPGAVAGIALEREVSPGTWENLIFQSGGANTLVARTWDAGAWAGETVRLRIYDNTTGGWGWTAVDNIVLTGVPIGVFSVPEVSDVTATAAQASVVTDTALDQARLLWDTTDKGTDDPADWTLGNLSLGAQAADATVSGQMTGLAADTLYTFRFYGEHDTETDWSLARTFATALTAAQTPVFSSAVSPGWYSVELTWLDNAATETGYVLQRSDSGSAGPYDVIATLAANTTSYTDTAVSATTTYHYRLAAVNSVNGSSTDPAACQTSVTTAEYDPNVALVAYWPLNDGPAGATVTVAQEVIGHPTYPAQNGVPNNSNATWYDDPERGIVFNTPNNNSLYGGIQEIYGDITWSVWAKTSGGGHILGNRNGTQEGFGWNSLTRVNWRTWAGELSFTALEEDTWSHLAVRRSGNQTAVFRNGVQVNTGTPRSATFRGAFRIGGDAHHWNEGYTGLISEAAVWTEALSDERILDLANGGPVIIPPPGGTIIMIR